MANSWKGFGWPSVADGGPPLFHNWANVSCYPGSGLSGVKVSVHPCLVRANTGQSPNSVSMLGQRRIRLTGIEPAMGCDAGPTSNRYWVGRPTLLYQVHRIDAYTDLSAMVVEEVGLHVEDILVSLIISIIISWTFKILALKGNLMFAKY